VTLEPSIVTSLRDAYARLLAKRTPNSLTNDLTQVYKPKSITSKSSVQLLIHQPSCSKL